MSNSSTRRTAVAVTIIAAGLWAGLAGCQTKGTETASGPVAQIQQPAATQPAATQPAVTAAKPGDCQQAAAGQSDCQKTAGGKPCDCQKTAGAKGDEVDDHSSHEVQAGSGAVNPVGPLDEKLGQPLGKVQAVELAALAADPLAFDGQTVQIQGQVTDMCYHKRGWFAVASPDGKRMIRVVTGPGQFLVPANAIGARAKAEGAVKVTTLTAQQIEYYRRSHKFISDEELRSGGPVRQAVVMATGAEFKR